MNVSIGAKTDAGRRPNNEDQLLVVDVRRQGLRADAVLIVADGMGGRQGGELASAAAVETVRDTLVEMLSGARAQPVPVGDALDSALRKANARVYALSQEAEQGMGTTCVVAVVEGERLWVAHAGDSRAYLLRDGRLTRLTDDHSYVAEQVRAGALSEESARRSRFRNVITRAVGIEPTLAPEVAEYDLRAGDALLLCTDGLSNTVAEEEIIQTLAYAPSAQAAADKLVQTAYRQGGRDNITAVVGRLEVGSRTLQMRAADLAPAGVAGASLPQTGEGHTERSGTWPAAGIRALLGPVLAAAVILVLLSATLAQSRLLRRAGYRFQAIPPFVTAPQPPARPMPPPDPAALSYSRPQTFFVAPVQGGLLARDSADGSLTAVTLTGQTVRLAADGRVLFKFPAPVRQASAAALTAVPAEGNLHFAVNSRGNLYVSDAAARTIIIYRPNGDPLARLPDGWLQHPAALAAADDGTIFVIDNERLKIIHAAPASAKRPPDLMRGGPDLSAPPLPSPGNLFTAPGRAGPPARPYGSAPVPGLGEGPGVRAKRSPEAR